MTLLKFFFIISGIIIFIIWLDVAKKQRFNALHFLVFLWVWAWLLVFTFFPNILQNIWDVFGVARWADVLVYGWIIFLLYFVLLLLTKYVENREDITRLVREFAIEKSKKVDIVWKEVFLIPSYNEWEVIINTIENILKKDYKNIIVINDGSEDNTWELLEKFSKKIIILTHFANRWQWAALETGFEYVRRFWKIKYVVTYDADWQHSIDDLKKFEKILKNDKEIDVLLWSRFIWEKKTKIPFFRKIILRLGVLFTFFISNISLTDTHNWYRVIRKNALNKIKITQDGMSHASEILDMIAENKLIYKEVPVTIKYTNYSLKKWQKSGNAINIALRILWSKFFR